MASVQGGISPWGRSCPVRFGVSTELLHEGLLLQSKRWVEILGQVSDDASEGIVDTELWEPKAPVDPKEGNLS